MIDNRPGPLRAPTVARGSGVLALSVIVALIAVTACAEAASTSPSPTATPEGPQRVVIAEDGSSILYIPGWSVAGPDAVGTVSFSTGGGEAYGLVTVRRFGTDKAGASIQQYSASLVDELRDRLGPLHRLVSAAATHDGLPAREVTFSYAPGQDSAGGLALHLLRGDSAYAVRGSWTDGASAVTRQLVVEIVRSFRPADGTETEAVLTSEAPLEIAYEATGGDRRVAGKLALGSYMALDDNSLWEVALADRLVALRWADGQLIRVEPSPAGEPFPYALVIEPGDSRISARYVGRGEGFAP